MNKKYPPDKIIKSRTKTTTTTQRGKSLKKYKRIPQKKTVILSDMGSRN
jgi:hypothetical protein